MAEHKEHQSELSQKYQNLLRDYIRTVIEKIRKNDEEIYAIALACEPECIEILIYWTTEEHFSEVLKDAQNGPSGEFYKESKWISSLRYSSGDFAYHSEVGMENLLDFISESLYTENSENLIDAKTLIDLTAEVISNLEDDLEPLKKTDDFIFFIDLHDAGDLERLEVLKKTVSKEKIRMALQAYYGELLEK